jgi:hypothetical protein
MLCLSTMRDNHLAAAARWREQESGRSKNPPADIDRWYQSCLAEMRAANARRKRPRPVCEKCGTVCLSGDRGRLYRDLCSTCESRELDGLILASIKRRGCRRTIEALHRLAGK